MEPNLEKARGDRKKQLCAGVPSPHMAISSSATHHHSNWQLTARRCWQGTAAQVQHCALNSTRRRRRKGKRERERQAPRASIYLDLSIEPAIHHFDVRLSQTWRRSQALALVFCADQPCSLANNNAANSATNSLSLEHTTAMAK